MPYYNHLRGKWVGSIYSMNKRMSKQFITEEEARAWEAEIRDNFPAAKPWALTGCHTERSDQRRENERNRAASRRAKFISNLGPCVFCGSTKKVEMHHIDPEKKVSHRITNAREEKVRGELAKCVALCRSCHGKFEGLLQRKELRHGTVSGYDEYGCRCSQCRTAKMEKKRRLQANRRKKQESV